MRRAIVGTLVIAILVAAAFVAGGALGSGPRAQALQGPRLLPTPTPTPTPKPPPRPKPKPKPAYPALPKNSGSGRRVVYSNPRQRVWIIDKGQHVIGSWLVSGRKNVPSGGNYKVFSRSRYTTSGDYRMEYMVRFAHGRTKAIGFHQIPVDGNGRPAQSESQLGTYQSHGCVRQRKSDAIKMWNFAQVDTPVVVTY
jgi:lipoprotein-anchoring transpeptidase ErfK/SrfK